MDPRARSLLEKLLHAGDKVGAGVRSREAALTASHLASYRGETSLRAKEEFETTMNAARQQGAVALTWDGRQEGNGFIKRVDLLDGRALAAFLGIAPLADILAGAEAAFAPHEARYPVLGDVWQRWAQLRTVRGYQPDSVSDWLAAIQVIESARELGAAEGVAVPIREASVRLFKDSKRIEKLVGPVDVLLCSSVEAAPREPAAVWEELGLFREEHPALLAGNVIVRRGRVTACLDAPYSGLPTGSVLGLEGPAPAQVLTVENLTTFHSEAKRRYDENVLLIYTGGMPSPAWRAMCGRILRSVARGTRVSHWGDVDEGGFRIASVLARDAHAAGHALQPWKMHPDDVPEAVRRPATPYVLGRIQHFATLAGWQTLGEAVAAAGFTAEQEAL
jgi:hypothetical protein